jgi:hypothetical protein
MGTYGLFFKILLIYCFTDNVYLCLLCVCTRMRMLTDSLPCLHILSGRDSHIIVFYPEKTTKAELITLISVCILRNLCVCVCVCVCVYFPDRMLPLPAAADPIPFRSLPASSCVSVCHG